MPVVITIEQNTTLTASSPEASPQVAILSRIDQTLEWVPTEGLSWPNPEGDQPDPIVFLPGGIDGYLHWPGSTPSTNDPRPTPGTPDRRTYTASANKVLEPGDPLVIEKYHYAFVVCSEDDPGCSLTIDPNLTRAPKSQRWTHGDGVWHDPEVENRNQP
jgi:hypothetical protein